MTKAAQRLACFAAAASIASVSAGLTGATYFGSTTTSLLGRDREAGWYFSSGFNLVRIPVPWSAVEGLLGVYNWTVTDTAVQNALTVYIPVQVWLTVTGANPLYDGGMAPTSPQAVAAFVAFARAAATRYGKNATALECWDEPNRVANWPPAPNATAYGTLCAAAGKAMMQAAPGATVLGLSAAPAADGSGLDSAFLKAAIDAGITSGLSAIHIKLGRWDASTGIPVAPEELTSDPEALQALVRRYGASVPLLAASYNYPAQPLSRRLSGQSGAASVPVAGDGVGPANIDPFLQAKWAGRAFLHNRALGLNVTLWHAWRDGEMCENNTTAASSSSNSGSSSVTGPYQAACYSGVVESTYQNNTMPYVVKPAYWGASAANGRGVGSNCAYVSTIPILASGNFPSDPSAPNTTQVCYAQYWDCGFLTPAFNAWCHAPEGWVATITFPYNPPSDSSGAQGVGARSESSPSSSLHSFYASKGVRIYEQAQLLSKLGSSTDANNVTGVCYWPLNYQGFQADPLVCSGGSPLSWTLDIGDSIVYLVATIDEGKHSPKN